MERSGVLPSAHAWRAGTARTVERGELPRVVDVHDAHVDGVPRGAIAAALDAVRRQLRPCAATFFAVGGADELTSSFVHAGGSDAVRTVAGWKRALHGVDPLAPSVLADVPTRVATLARVGAADPSASPAAAVYRGIGVCNDVRLLVRDDERLVGGVTLWRGLRSRVWTARQLELLGALQVFVERAYVEAARDTAGDDGLGRLLTRREREVARLVAAGATNAEIARALQIGAETAKSHTSAILAKLGLASRRDVMLQLPSHGGPPADAADDDATTAQLLAALLQWASLRIDGTAGGYAAISSRATVVASAASLAPLRESVVSDASAEQIHDALLAPAFLRALTQGALPVDVVAGGAVHPRAARVGALAEGCGWTEPLVVVLRLHGRVAGLLGVARSRRSRHDDAAAVAALRGMLPLVEAACAPVLRRALVRSSADEAVFARLTRREQAVARAAVDGASNATIALALGISEATVKAHMTRVLAKCGVRSRAQLIALAGAADRARGRS